EWILSLACRFGVTVPPEFLNFFYDVELVSRMRSPTDCYFRFPEKLIQDPTTKGSYAVHFFSDSQNCFESYLYLHPDHGHCVVAGSVDLAHASSNGVWNNRKGKIVF